MNIKNELIKFKEKIENAFTSKSVKELEAMTKSKDPLGYEALVTAIGRFIESKNEIENEDKTLKEQVEKISEKER